MSDHEGDLGGIPLYEELSESDDGSRQLSTKRKRDTDEPVESKRSKKRKNMKRSREDDNEILDTVTGVNNAIAHMDSSLMADHIAQRTKRFKSDLTAVEAEDLRISEQAIKDTSSFDQTRTSENLANFLERFAGRQGKRKGPSLSSAPEAKGSPHTLVIAAAGLRAADLTRSLRKFQSKNSLVAKLFAKHIKLKEAAETAKKTRMGIGVGTPQRVIDLLENGSLKSDHIRQIVVDASHIDQKKRGILDIKEIQVPLVRLLTRAEFKDRYSVDKSKIELLFF